MIQTYLPLEDRLRVREAFELAKRVHGDQRRRSGEPFFTHPLTVAYYLAIFQLDAPTLMAALLHDVAEDTYVSLEEIEELFGGEVMRLVDGVTKLKEVSAEFSRGRELTPEEIRDASLHKMFGAMTGDVRVVLVKLFDRFHNMRTIGAMPRRKQEEKARETLYVYAPLANRLGIWWLKSELEAYSFQVLNNEAFDHVSQMLETLIHRRQAVYGRVSEQILELLVENGLVVKDVKPSDQSVSSVYKSLADKSDILSLNKMDVPLRFTILLEDESSCYLALGLIHKCWRPVPGQFDDYIAAPRENLYRALHTTVIYTDGEPLKIRFRSVAMHEVSEIGVLARWVYAGSPLWTQGVAKQVDALITEVNKSISLESQTFSSAVKGLVEDVFSQQIMVYTPNGDVIELPQGATAIDFAYAIHSEVGNQCQNAYVNDEPYPLNKPLKDGDRVRIGKSGWGRVQRTWLDEDLGFLKTSRAKAQVRRWFRRISAETAYKQGKELLEGELTLIGMGNFSHEEAAKILEFDEPDKLYYALGRADVLPTQVATMVLEKEWSDEPVRNVGRTVRSESGQEFVVTNTTEKDLRLCKACNPRPGDTIIGFIRSGGGVTIHKEGCYALRPDPQTRSQIKLSWGRKGSYQVRNFTIQVNVFDRSGLIYDLSELLNSEEINISTINTPPGIGNGRLHVVLTIEVANARQLVRILHRAQTLINVYDVQCLPRYGNGLVAASFKYLPTKEI
ncbi:MAG: RelA/SpoT family protein [Candidatus Promineifilaceae bacterium]